MKRRFTTLALAMAILTLALSGCAVSKPEETAIESTLQQAAPPQNITAPPSTKPEETAAASEPVQQPEKCVHAQWAEDAFPDLSDYERLRLGLDEEQPLIYFSTDQTVTDFKELSLTFESVDDDGNVRFAVEETYDHGTMTPEVPLLVRMELMGTIPNNGISYIDSNGNTRYFSLNVSGYDGSLLLEEFSPQG